MDPLQGDEQIDPTIVANEDAPTTGTSRDSPSLRSMIERVLETQLSHHTMMETFFMTQTAYGQLLDSLNTDVTIFKVEFN